MKRFTTVLIAGLAAVPLLAQDFTVKAVKGTVEVRRGVAEEWKKLKVGDLLKPEDSMRTGKGASARIEFDSRKLSIPEMTIIDISDLRHLTQEEFLLKLAMENILSVPSRESDELLIPRATVLHGSDRSRSSESVPPLPDLGRMQLQGVKVLFDNAYYATAILKAKATLRKHPEFKSDFDVRMVVAQSFDRMKLKAEAIVEYSLLAKEELTPAQARTVEAVLARLKAE